MSKGEKYMGEIDVLYCVSQEDLNFKFTKSVLSCVKYFTLLRDIYFVTNNKNKLEDFIDKNLKELECDFTVMDDNEIISELKIPGWYKQQIIKLRSYQFIRSKYICCLGADAILRDYITYEDLFYNNQPIIYFNRYLHTEKHLMYERERVKNVSQLLDVEPKKSLILGDFIMELFLFDSNVLELLEEIIAYKYDSYETLLKNVSCSKLSERNKFGEWTLYSVFLLEVLKVRFKVKNSRNVFVEQIHSKNDLIHHNCQAKIVHVVDKNISLHELYKTHIIEVDKDDREDR